MSEIALTIGLAVGLGWPLGIYMARVWQGESTWLDPVLTPDRGVFYGLSGVDRNKGQGWLAYTFSFLAFWRPPSSCSMRCCGCRTYCR